MVLQNFHISEDPEHPIDPLAARDGFIVQPDPFQAKFELRRSNKELVSLLDREE